MTKCLKHLLGKKFATSQLKIIYYDYIIHQHHIPGKSGYDDTILQRFLEDRSRVLVDISNQSNYMSNHYWYVNSRQRLMSESSRILVELVEAQESALQTANELLSMKNALIQLLEDEIRLRKRQNLILASILIACFITFTFILSLFCIL